jgi:hypothetical protein
MPGYGFNPMYGGSQNGQMGAWAQNGGGRAMQGAPGSAGGGYAQQTPPSQSFWPGELHSSYQQPAAGVQSFQPRSQHPGYSPNPTGSSTLDMIQNMAMSNAMGANVGARRSAQNSAGMDPSMAAFAGLNSLIGGQGNAAHNINQGAFGYLQQQQAQQWQEHMARLQAQLQMDNWKQQQPGWGQQLLGMAGTLGGAYLGGPAGAALGNRLFGGGGQMSTSLNPFDYGGTASPEYGLRS